MPGSPTFPLYDRMLDGRLTGILRDNKAAGLSPLEIRDVLRDDFEISVSPDTVRRWLRDLEAA